MRFFQLIFLNFVLCVYYIVLQLQSIDDALDETHEGLNDFNYIQSSVNLEKVTTVSVS